MRVHFFFTALLCFLMSTISFAATAGPEQQFLVTYPDSTPDSIVAEAENTITQAVRPSIMPVFCEMCVLMPINLYREA